MIGMKPESELPGDFQVSMSFVTRQQLRDAHNSARSEGRDGPFLSALQTILERLRANPIEFGEELFELASLKITVKIAVLLPIVYPERRLVFIRTFRYLPSASK